MTIEDIERAHSREIQIRRLRREIKEHNSNLLPSHTKAIEVNGEIQYTTGGGSSLPSSTVEEHFRQLERLEERLREAEKRQRLFWNAVDTIEDDEIQSIIYWRVSRLDTWAHIAYIVYGHGASRMTPYLRLKRWAEKEETDEIN